MPSLELLYFGIKGRAEASRLALAIGDVEFKNETFSGDKFSAMKESGRLPFGQVPLLSVDGVDYSQSQAILRYCGKQSGLYPRDDDLLAMAIDEVLGACDDILSGFFAYKGSDKEKAKESREEFKTMKAPKLLGGLEKIVKAKAKSETWLCGDSITIADLQLYYVIGNVAHGNIDHVGIDTFESYPRLMASYNAVIEHPKVAAWNAEHPWKKARVHLTVILLKWHRGRFQGFYNLRKAGYLENDSRYGSAT